MPGYLDDQPRPRQFGRTNQSLNGSASTKIAPVIRLLPISDVGDHLHTQKDTSQDEDKCELHLQNDIGVILDTHKKIDRDAAY